MGAIRIQPYHEFARNLPVPTNLNLIHLKPLRGTGLVVFSPSLVFIAVDNLFGGDGRFPTKVEGREFTHTEQRVINRMLKLALEGYSDAWKAINPLEVGMCVRNAGEIYQYHHLAERYRRQYAVSCGDRQSDR